MAALIKHTIIGALLAALASNALADELLRSAQDLINQDQPDAALTVLSPHEGQRAGEVEFDYLLGLALLDTGDASRAILVFERVLAIKPNFHGARLDFARALFATGRYDEAAVELAKVANSNPPAPAQGVISQYQQRIEQRNRRLKFSRYIEVGTRAGYDSNVNSATELGEFLGFQLNDTSREQDSDFVEVGIGVGGAYRPRQGLVLDGRLSYATRKNGQASFADTDVLVASLRGRSDTAMQRRMLAVQGFALDVDGEDNNSAATVSGQWEFLLRDHWWLGVAARYGAIRYGDELEIKDVDQVVLALTAGRTFGALNRGLFRARLGFGSDDPTESGSRYARDILLADVSLDWRFTSTVSGRLAASVEDSDYDEVFFAQEYDDARSDITWRGRGALDWRFARNWRFNHTLSYARNETDTTIFEYERFEFGLGFVYVWN